MPSPLTAAVNFYNLRFELSGEAQAEASGRFLYLGSTAGELLRLVNDPATGGFGSLEAYSTGDARPVAGLQSTGRFR
jgi:hypothetical protein